MKQLVSALKYLHEKKEIVHKDIKPDNLLVELIDFEAKKIQVKLTDFGFAAFKSNQ